MGFEWKDYRAVKTYLQKQISDREFKNYCTEYKFDFFADNEDFNERFNIGENYKILTFDRTGDLLQDIQKVIQINSNIIIFVYGTRNMGKSEVAQALMLYYKQMFKIFRKRDVNDYIGFSDGDMAKIFPEMKKGDIATRDESPYLSGEGSTTTKRNLENICNITRGYQVSFIFVNPYLIEQEGVDYYLEIAGKNIRERKTRCLLYDRRQKLLGVVYVPLHDDEEKRKEYLRRKKENIKKIMANAGGQYAGVDKETLLKNSIAIYDYCYERGVSTKINIETQITNYNTQNTQEINGTDKYLKKLVQNVYNALHGESSILDDYIKQKRDAELLEELSQKVSEPEFILEKELEIVEEQEESGFELVIGIMKMWAYGVGYREICYTTTELSNAIVQDILILFKRGKRHQKTIPDEWRTYKVYEYWIAYKYNAEIISGHRKPDLKFTIEDNAYYGECKLWDDIKKNITMDKLEKFNTFKSFPDIPYFPVFFRNVKWGDYDYLFKVEKDGYRVINFRKDEEFILNGVFDPEDFFSF